MSVADCPLEKVCEVFEYAPEECTEQCFEYQCYLYNVKG